MEKKESLTKQDSGKTLDFEMDDVLIDVDRISIGQHQADNIQCFLCFRIPFSPLLIACCEQIICNFCLKNWKLKNDICPHCRKEGFEANIPNKFIKRIYADIKYYCAFKEKGCPKNDLAYFQISPHEETCEFNPDRIINCGNCEEKYCFKTQAEHDCIKVLKEKTKKQNDRINDLEKEIKNLKESKSQKTEIEGLIDEFSYLSQTLKLHRHVLIKSIKSSLWRCNGCTSVSSGSESLYCFECDVDLCYRCFSNSINKQAKNYNHPHELLITNLTQNCFICDNCRTRNDQFMLRFRCQPCDYDICFKCRF